MSSLKSKLETVNTALFTDQRLDLIPEYFSSEYIVHITGDDVAGGHDIIRSISEAYFEPSPS